MVVVFQKGLFPAEQLEGAYGDSPLIRWGTAVPEVKRSPLPQEALGHTQWRDSGIFRDRFIPLQDFATVRNPQFENEGRPLDLILARWQTTLIPAAMQIRFPSEVTGDQREGFLLWLHCPHALKYIHNRTLRKTHVLQKAFLKETAGMPVSSPAQK